MDKLNFGAFPSSKPPLSVWDILSILALLITICIAGYYLLIFINPYSGLNPLPPPTPYGMGQPAPTITPLQPPPTWTPTATTQPTPTITIAPTWTPIPTNTPYLLVTPSKTPKPSATPKVTYPFTATVSAIESTILHPELGCNWLGVGGETTDLNNSPVLYLVVRMGGTVSGKIVDPNLYTTVTGVAPQYGRAGFEFQLGNVPVASEKNALWIQLLDQAGLPLSDKIYFSTYNDCKKNLILVRFKKVK
ncbi:MAG: hypothetical protein ACUVRJ_07875 [Candidatus Villigracilaceae bacterium]